MGDSSDEEAFDPNQDSRYVRYRRRKRNRENSFELHVSEESEELDSPDETIPVHNRPKRVHQPEESHTQSDSSSHCDSSQEDDLDVDAPVDNMQEHGDTHIGDDPVPQPINSDDEDDDHRDAVDVVEATSESDPDSHEDEARDNDVPLYHGAPLTVHESLMTVLTLSAKHHLSGKCMVDLLYLIKVHCPPENNCVHSLYKYKKYFAALGNESIKFHYFCTKCVSSLDSKDAVCTACEGEQENSFFIELPIKDQLQSMLRRPGFFNALQYRFERRKSSSGSTEDIYDGEMYREQFINNGFLSDPNNISFGWYSDGVAIYNSSNFQIWPLFLTINELRHKDRTQKENTILAGLWFGSLKPNPNIFLRPFHSFITEFRNQGYYMEVAGRQPVLMKGIILYGVADLPAKSTFMRFKQWNGAYGCLHCMSKGERYFLNEITRSSVQVYPYSRDITLRNNVQVAQFAAEAVQLRQTDPDASVFGVKGPSLLYYMVPNMIRCTAIDKMHGADYGAGKQVLNLMFDPTYANELFSASRVVGLVNSRLKSIKPPSFVERMPRSIPTPTTAQWKSQEYKHWLMFYSIPVLLGLVDDNILTHHCLLVSALFLLNQHSISDQDINIASELLHSYVSQFQELYGLRHLGMNIHQLLHLPQVVRDLGPLWVYSCYYYEDLNGKLARLIHGTRHAGTQVSCAASSYLNLPFMIRQMDHGVPRRFCEMLTSNVKSFKVAEEIAPGTYAGGVFKNVPSYDNVTRIALEDVGIHGGCCMYFHRLRKKGVIYYSSSYSRSIQKESTYVQILDNDVPRLGRVRYFVRWSDCGPTCPLVCMECDRRYFCFLSLFERQQWFIHNIPSVRLPYLSMVHPTNTVAVLPTESLQYLCYYMDIEGTQYIATPVNELEAD